MGTYSQIQDFTASFLETLLEARLDLVSRRILQVKCTHSLVAKFLGHVLAEVVRPATQEALRNEGQLVGRLHVFTRPTQDPDLRVSHPLWLR